MKGVTVSIERSNSKNVMSGEFFEMFGDRFYSNMPKYVRIRCYRLKARF